MDFKILIQRIFEILLGFISSLIIPIDDFMIAICILATLNILFGLAEDKFRFSFKKAFKSFLYLAGYLFLLILAVLYGDLMHVAEENTVEFTSWITWVMIWFYGVNILKNWSAIQPDNRIIQFFYWVVSFKLVEKIKFLNEFNERGKDKNLTE